jgi:hypothetical protein
MKRFKKIYKCKEQPGYAQIATGHGQQKPLGDIILNSLKASADTTNGITSNLKGG